MRFHLGCQRPDFGMAFALFVLSHILDQAFDFGHHPVKLEANLGNLVIIFALKRHT
ncbi:hypothetical protein D3C87_2093720 [compost metagenome]